MSDFCLHLCLICIFVITANILSYVASLQCSVLRRKPSSIHTASETIHHLEKWGTQRSVMCSTHFNHHFNFIYINKSGLLASECSSAEKHLFYANFTNHLHSQFTSQLLILPSGALSNTSRTNSEASKLSKAGGDRQIDKADPVTFWLPLPSTSY